VKAYDTAAEPGHALTIEGLGRRFGAVNAVTDVSMAVPPGQRRAVLGANGAGKTTLFNLVAGDLPPSSGRITLLGEDVTALAAPDRVHRGLRRTYQDAMLFTSLTVRENLFVAARGVRRHRLSLRRPRTGDRALAEADDLISRVGLDGLEDTPVSELSHGQQRVLEIAMALVGEPRLLLLDEPAAGLSPGDRAALAALLAGLPQELTVVLIEHDMDIALPASDFVTVMHNGEVLREGTPDEIQADATVQRIYMGGGGD
jgi:branched-chain amino acid transport system ATP-binding protein